jgi:hypothetical protein
MAAGVLAGVAAGAIVAAAPVLTNAAATQPLLTSSGLLTRYHAPSSLTATISTVTPWGSLPITAAVLLGRTRTLRRGGSQHLATRRRVALCAHGQRCQQDAEGQDRHNTEHPAAAAENSITLCI